MRRMQDLKTGRGLEQCFLWTISEPDTVRSCKKLKNRVFRFRKFDGRTVNSYWSELHQLKKRPTRFGTKSSASIRDATRSQQTSRSHRHQRRNRPFRNPLLRH